MIEMEIEMLLKGKKVLIMGLANEFSIAWGIVERLHKEGAEFCFTWARDQMQKRVEPLAASVGSDFVLQA
ncbi:MAG: SDR family oxidoreductase, partial [Rickettsiales bacterium]|nr:SDR family oxidoreductase [Rickettsiales bacterium]